MGREVTINDNNNKNTYKSLKLTKFLSFFKALCYITPENYH